MTRDDLKAVVMATLLKDVSYPYLLTGSVAISNPDDQKRIMDRCEELANRILERIP